jgi:hypothetical protein
MLCPHPLSRAQLCPFFFKLRAQMRCPHGSCVLKPRADALAARPLRCSPATVGTRKVLPVCKRAPVTHYHLKRKCSVKQKHTSLVHIRLASNIVARAKDCKVQEPEYTTSSSSSPPPHRPFPGEFKEFCTCEAHLAAAAPAPTALEDSGAAD